MKKILVLAAALLVSASILYAEPESKMEKSFKETFPTAKDVKWHQDADGYLVSFTQGTTPVKIAYDRKGKFLQSLRYYGEKDLPTNILMAVKNKYHGKDIYGVTEQTTSDEVTYHITLYDGTSLQAVKAFSNGTVKEEEDAVEETND